MTLDADARAKVQAAVQAAESRSRGQIVPVIVERSSTHVDSRLRAALLGLGLATASLVGIPRVTVGLLLAVQGTGLLVGYALSAIPAVLRIVAGKRALGHAAHDRAMRAFLEHDLPRTRERVGVLVFASVLERQVVVLGDDAIHDKMKDGEWERAVAALTAGLKRGAPADGFCQAIGIVGDKLAEHFPKSEGGANELPDRLEVDEK
jgi:putative membrane protein